MSEILDICRLASLFVLDTKKPSTAREARISLTRKEKEDGMYCMDGIQLSWLDLIIFFLLFLQGQVKGIGVEESEKLDLFFLFLSSCLTIHECLMTTWSLN